MIVLFTDFGLHGPYAGQMRAVLHQMVTSTSIIDLFADAPVGNPKHRPTCWRSMLHGFLRVPSFFASSIPASAERAIVEAESRWYVRPGNGLFELVQCRAGEIHSWSIDWKPEDLSSSFHGRDLFAPVVAMLARGEPPPGRPCQEPDDNWKME